MGHPGEGVCIAVLLAWSVDNINTLCSTIVHLIPPPCMLCTGGWCRQDSLDCGLVSDNGDSVTVGQVMLIAHATANDSVILFSSR